MFVYLDSKDTADGKIIIIQDDGAISAQTLITELTNKLNVMKMKIIIRVLIKDVN